MPTEPLDLLHLLFDTARMLRVEAGRRARARGLARGEFAAMAVLARNPGLTQRELAQRLDVEPITVARLLDRLALRGLVERRPDPRDRRVWRLHPGPDAGKLTRSVTAEMIELSNHLVDGMEPAAMDGLTAGLHHIAGVLSAMAAAPRGPGLVRESVLQEVA
ncbi:MAG: MarR family transcriptional regulator [Rhodospirillales bacterium]|nr:MarR family transcriptional regulator [Rhodospirillales bacterium]